MWYGVASIDLQPHTLCPCAVAFIDGDVAVGRPFLVERLLEEVHRVGYDLVAAAGDGVVLVFDDLEGGTVAVGLLESLAAPHGHYAVAVAMK